MTGRTRSTTEDDLVKVAYSSDESEAELLQGLLRTADVSSVVRRTPGFDVPEFLAAGPREVLVAASDVPRDSNPRPPGPQPGARRAHISGSTPPVRAR
jgi:hypothetical protein